MPMNGWEDKWVREIDERVKRLEDRLLPKRLGPQPEQEVELEREREGLIDRIAQISNNT